MNHMDKDMLMNFASDIRKAVYDGPETTDSNRLGTILDVLSHYKLDKNDAANETIDDVRADRERLIAELATITAERDKWQRSALSYGDAAMDRRRARDAQIAALDAQEARLKEERDALVENSGNIALNMLVKHQEVLESELARTAKERDEAMTSSANWKKAARRYREDTIRLYATIDAKDKRIAELSGELDEAREEEELSNHRIEELVLSLAAAHRLRDDYVAIARAEQKEEDARSVGRVVGQFVVSSQTKDWAWVVKQCEDTIRAGSSEDLGVSKAPSGAWSTDGFRVCEWCGCNSNARQRYCCDTGRDADVKKCSPPRDIINECRCGALLDGFDARRNHVCPLDGEVE
jgi:hypothetical protein